MRKVFLIISCLGLQHITFTGCFCELEPPPYGYSVAINLLDINTGRTLIDSRDSVYYPDSIILEMKNPMRSYRMAVDRRDSILRSDHVFPGSTDIDTLYFRYRTTLGDTLIVFFHDEKKRACGESFSVVEIDKAIVNRVIVCEPCNDLREPLLIRK